MEEAWQMAADGAWQWVELKSLQPHRHRLVSPTAKAEYPCKGYPSVGGCKKAAGSLACRFTLSTNLTLLEVNVLEDEEAEDAHMRDSLGTCLIA